MKDYQWDPCKMKKKCKRNAVVVQRNQEVNVGDMWTKSALLCATNVLSQKKSTVVKMKGTEMSMLAWPCWIPVR